MNEENILDFQEKKSTIFEKYWSEVISCLFFLFIPIILVLIIHDDAKFFLSKNGIIEFIVPNSLIYFEDEFQIGLDEITIALFFCFYFFCLALFNLGIWKKDKLKKFRILHSSISILFPILILYMFVEDDILHYAKLLTPRGKQQFLIQTNFFILLSIIWIGIQIVYFKKYISEVLVK